MTARSLVCALALLAPPSLAQDESKRLQWSGDISLANALVYRGLLLSSEPVVPGATIALEDKSGLFLHSWLTRVDLDGLLGLPENDQWQFLFDVGYRWRFARDWSLALAHNWYLYSGEYLNRKPNYTEWSGHLNYSSYATLSYAHSDKLWGLDTRQDVVSLSGRWPFTRRFFGEAELGWVEQRYFTTDTYWYARLNLGYVIRHWSLQVQYHNTEDSPPLYVDERSGEQWVFKASWHW